MATNRPTGRKTYSSGKTGSVGKTGSGLGTGPVGNANYSGQNNSGSGKSGGNRAVTRGSIGGAGGLIIVVLAIFLLKNCGKTTTSTTGTIMNLLGSGYSYETTTEDYTDVSTTTSVSSSSDKALDTSVAKGSRDKFTSILGNKNDKVTILVYMCGTDLESKSGMGSADLKEMCSATLGSNVNVIVYTGGCKAWKTTGISSSVNQIYKIENGSLTRLESDMGSKTMTDPATLTEFIKYGASKYPANRLCLIFWDHGGGSVSGYGYDEKFTNSGSMTLSGIDKALKNAGRKFDFIGFDACLMATLENGLMLADYADYMIASEETEPGVGWYYTNWLTALGSNPSMSTLEVGKNIVDDFVSVCAKKCSGQNTTLSVVDLAELSNTVPSKLTSFAKSTTAMIQSDNYKTVSDARSDSREFSPSSKIDQVDLIDFATKINTTESKALATALRDAVKYNRTSSKMTNSYGISIFFPMEKPSKVDSMAKTYEAIGMDSAYTSCIKEYAGLEVCGQASGGGSNSVLSSLLSGYSGSSSATGSSVGSILSLLGGLSGGSSSAADGTSTALLSFLTGRSMSNEDTANYISKNYFDATQLVWTAGSNGVSKIVLPESQWDLVQDLALNVMYDDGEGYIDLGMDNVFEFDNDGNLLGNYDGSWLAINDQIVAYYILSSENDVIYGYVPALVNGQRAELQLVFNKEYPQGYITGAKYIYDDTETGTIAKNLAGLKKGDVLEFICDYYDYNGNYKDSYRLGSAVTLGDTITIENIKIDKPQNLKATYRFTDIYRQNYWTPVIP